MGVFGYLAVSVTAFLGVLVGAVLAFISPEEMEPGARYFVYMQKVLLALLIVSLVLYQYYGYLVLLITALFIIAEFYVRAAADEIRYALFALVFYITSTVPEHFFASALIIFLYGLPTGSMRAYALRKPWKETLIMLTRRFGWFVLLAMLPFLFVYA